MPGTDDAPHSPSDAVKVCHRKVRHAALEWHRDEGSRVRAPTIRHADVVTHVHGPIRRLIVHLDRPATPLWLLLMGFITWIEYCVAARTQADHRRMHVANLKSRAAAAALLASTVIAPSSAAPLNVTYFAPVPNASDNLGTVDLGTNII